MKTPPRNKLPGALYSAQSVRELEQLAIQQHGITGYELMKRAGRAVFEELQNRYPIARRVLVLCGAGNNAGDGYVVARLAHKAGLHVDLVSMADGKRLTADAHTAWQEWHALGRQSLAFNESLLQTCDVVIDALLGTGLKRDVEGDWAELIEMVNGHPVPVIAVDIPSGLCADTGRIAGVAINAEATVSFIGLKKGMLTHHGVDCCGELLFDSLGVPESIYQHVQPQAHLFEWQQLKPLLHRRAASTHKHQCGHVLVLGGDQGMPGAARLAAEAALRAGAGLVTVVSHPEHSTVLMSGRPEIMLAPSVDGHVAAELLAAADALVVGPGLVDSAWSRNLLASTLESTTPKVVDAGALRLLDENDGPRNDWVLTPHPGEAAALLGESAASLVQDSRFSSLELIQQRYGGVVILKGAGSLMLGGDGLIHLCRYGNPGMATAGMGDVLSGLLGSLLAQGYGLAKASQLGLCIHALSGDIAAQESGEKGMLASDLFTVIRKKVNAID